MSVSIWLVKRWLRIIHADLDVGDTPFDIKGTQQLDTIDQGYDTSNNGTVGS